jgi:hypothetical protein
MWQPSNCSTHELHNSGWWIYFGHQTVIKGTCIQLSGSSIKNSNPNIKYSCQTWMSSVCITKFDWNVMTPEVQLLQRVVVKCFRQPSAVGHELVAIVDQLCVDNKTLVLMCKKKMRWRHFNNWAVELRWNNKWTKTWYQVHKWLLVVGQ